MKAFASTRPFDGRDDYAEALAKALGADFTRLVPERIWPQVVAQEREARSAFTVALFWVTPAGVPRWADVNFHLVAGPRYTSRSTNDSLATSNKLRPVTLGNLMLIDELQHGCRNQNIDYVQLRTDQSLGTALAGYLAYRLARTK